MGRGQTFTLEAFVASILLLATVAFALQTVAVSSNTASSASAEFRNQQAGLATGVLDRAVENGSLQRTLLYWDEDDERFHNASDDFYVSRSPPTAFGTTLGESFGDRQVRYNVDLYFAPGENATRGHQRLVESGSPGDDAIRVVETVTLYDDTRLVAANGTRRTTTLGDVDAEGNATFYAPDAAGNRTLYNVVRVEVVLWKT